MQLKSLEGLTNEKERKSREREILLYMLSVRYRLGDNTHARTHIEEGKCKLIHGKAFGCDI